MASPFRYFRKHTKAFMAIAAVMCMFLFVFASGTGGGGGSDDRPDDDGDPVATWNGGSLNVGQLRGLVQQRMVTDQFLRMLFAEGGGASPYDLPPSVPEFLLRSNSIDAVELEVVNTEVFSSLATEAGMTVDDAMINYYLQEFGLNRVGTPELQGILANIGSKNVGSNTAIVFSQLRKLLLSYFYRRGYDDAGAVVLPTQRWDDWRRVNERISLQVAVLPVEGFLADVPEPTPAQLKKLYDEYDDAEPNVVLTVGGRELPSPNPGFAVPRRVKVRYLQGSVAERTAALLASVTQEEIADYYERNKRRDFVKTEETEEDFGGEEAEGDTAGEAGESTEEDEAAEGEPADEDAAEGEVETTEEADEAEPAADAAADPAGDEEAEPAAEGATEPADEAPADEAAAPTTEETAPATEETQPAAGEGEQSMAPRRRSPFVLTALQAVPAAEESEVEDASEDAVEAVEEAEAAADDAAAVIEAEEPAEEAADVADPATDAAEAAAGAAEAVIEAAEAEGAAVAEAAAEEGLEAEAEEAVEYVPLEEVQDEIRETLARDKAVQELEKSIGEASAKLESEYRKYGRALITAQATGDKPPAAPERLASLGWLAEEYGLTAVTTDPLTDRELFETPVGKAVDEQSGRINVTQAVFLSLELFEPFLARELEGDWYLVMKVEDTPKRVPPLDEVRDQVAAAWKRIEAAKKAKEKAEDLAEEAEQSDLPFDQFFADQEIEVIEQTALFSWRSYPIGPGLGYPPELSDIPELKNVGPEMMEVAFGLEDGVVAGLLNYDHSVAYVVRLFSRQYKPEELQKLFLAEVTTWPGQFDMMRERQLQFSQTVNRRIWEDVAEFKFDEEWEQRRAERLAESQ